MAGNVKGIIVEIGGDTSGLQEALKKVNSATASISKELRGINTLLKGDPRSTELLAQKQKLLTKEIQETDTKLANLQFHQEQIAKSGVQLTEEQEKKYRALEREIIATTQKLQRLQIENSKFTQIGSKLSSIGEAMKGFGDKVTEVGKKVSILSGAVAGLFGIGVKYNMSIETSTKAFETFTGSAEEAEKAIKAIQKESKTSPFDTTELIKANQLLISTGLSADKSRNTISALADAIALTGGGNDELIRMASNLQQIQNAGKATSMDIRQFAYAGIDVYGVLAETLGKTTEEIKDMDISFEDLSNALIKASSEGGKYFKGQEKISDTLNGKISQLKKTFEDFMGTIAGPVNDTLERLTTHLQGVVEWFNNLSDAQKDLITKIGMVIVVAGPLIMVIGSIIKVIGDLFGALGTISTWIGEFTVKTLPYLMKGLTALFKLIMAHPIIAVTTVIIGALVLLYNKCEWFRNAVNNVVSAVWNFFANFGTNMKKLFTEIIPSFIKKALQFFNELPYKIGYIMGQVLGHLVKFGIDALKWCIENVPKIIWNIITFFSSLPSNIWNILTMVLSKIREWLANMGSMIWQNIPGIIQSIKNLFWELPGNMLEVGWNIVEGLWNGIRNAKYGLLNKIRGFAHGILDGFKDSLGIHSPSKLFENIVGKNIALGIGEGFDKNIGGVVRDMANQMSGLTTDISLIPSDINGLNRASTNNSITMQFYPKQMTEGDLNMAFNYVNRRLGTAY